MRRYLRTARSTIVALTSSGPATSSTRVPIWPGPQVVGRRVLDRRRVVVEDADALGRRRSGCRTRRRSRCRRSDDRGRPARPGTRSRRRGAAASATAPPIVARVEREALVEGPVLGEDRTDVRDRAARQRRDDRHALVRAELVLRVVRASCAALRRPPRSCTGAASPCSPASHATFVIVAGACSAHGHAVDRNAPLGADRVPVELVVIGESGRTRRRTV